MIDLKKYFIIIFFLVLSTQTLLSKDIIITIKPESTIDKRIEYQNRILLEVLNQTKKTHGSYEIVYKNAVSRKRALRYLEEGTGINIIHAPTQKIWEEKTIAIPIPLIKGLLGYRLFFIHGKNLTKFSKINTIEDLKQFRAGLKRQWSITNLMQKLDFKIVTNMYYEGLYGMLKRERFDYFPRGVNEIFQEYESRKQKYPDMVIEPNIALYTPIPIYFFVSKKHKKIAERIEFGLKKIIKNGKFDELFYEYNKENIKKANLSNRLILKVKNPFLTDITPLNKKGLWYKP